MSETRIIMNIESVFHFITIKCTDNYYFSMKGYVLMLSLPP